MCTFITILCVFCQWYGIVKNQCFLCDFKNKVAGFCYKWQLFRCVTYMAHARIGKRCEASVTTKHNSQFLACKWTTAWEFWPKRAKYTKTPIKNANGNFFCIGIIFYYPIVVDNKFIVICNQNSHLESSSILNLWWTTRSTQKS